MIRSYLNGILNLWRRVTREPAPPPWKQPTGSTRRGGVRKHPSIRVFADYPVRMPEKWRWWHRATRNADLTTRRRAA